MDEHIRYMRQHALEGVGEAGQKLFFSTEVLCEGEGLVLQTAAAYLEAAGFCLPRREARFHPGFWPSAWQQKAGAAQPGEPPATEAFQGRQRGFLGQLPCACPDDVDFWVLLGCFHGKPGFLFARGRDKKPFLETQLEKHPYHCLDEDFRPSAAHCIVAAWAALAFEKLALGLPPEAGGGSISPLGEAELWPPP